MMKASCFQEHHTKSVISTASGGQNSHPIVQVCSLIVDSHPVDEEMFYLMTHSIHYIYGYMA